MEDETEAVVEAEWMREDYKVHLMWCFGVAENECYNKDRYIYVYLRDKWIEWLSLPEILDGDGSEVILEPQCWHHTATMPKGDVTLQMKHKLHDHS